MATTETDPLPIIPFTRPARAVVRLPGSKSITNRALILAALGRGPVELRNALFSEDTEIMIDSLTRLGFRVRADREKDTVHVHGEGGRIPNNRAELFVGNAGTAARFLTALCCLHPNGKYKLDGVEQMRKRPMVGLLRALSAQGAGIEAVDDGFPLELQTRGLAGGPVEVDARASSQMLSALLMVAPLARRDTVFHLANGDVRLPFVVMTLRMMDQFGQEVFPAVRRRVLGQTPAGHWTFRGKEPTIIIPAGNLYRKPPDHPYEVEADVTAAGYFLALPLVTGGSLTIENLTTRGHSLQGDAAFFRVLEKLGCKIDETLDAGTTSALEDRVSGLDLSEDFTNFSDTFLTLAAISPLLRGEISITGIGHTRKQETDRVAAMAAELKKLGQHVTEDHDALRIRSRPLPVPQSAHKHHAVETYRDHRFAMSFALLGCRDLRGDARPWLAIRDPGCCAKTFPGFFATLEAVRRGSHGNLPIR